MADPPTLDKRTRDLLARMELAFDAIDRLLVRLATQGLQRVSESSVAELEALAQTAHNAKLTAIKRDLDVLATAVRRYLERDPLFTIDHYMALVNRVWLVNRKARMRREAGEMPADLVDLLGEARRSYTMLEAPLTLEPIGASGWVSDTDFVGITVYFRSLDHEDVLQASNAKPSAYFGTDPRRLLHQSISDYLSLSISHFSHRPQQFIGAKVSRDGRLSLHKDLVLRAAPSLGARAYDGLRADDWRDLLARLRQAKIQPLAGADSLFALIEARELGEMTIDRLSQTATLPALDRDGRELDITVRLRAENNFLIDNLERIAAGPQHKITPDGLFGTTQVARGRLTFFPYTAVFRNTVRLGGRNAADVHQVHLSLESLSELES